MLTFPKFQVRIIAIVATCRLSNEISAQHNQVNVKLARKIILTTFRSISLCCSQAQHFQYNWYNVGLKGRIILKRNLQKYDMKDQTGLIRIRMDPLAGFCEHGNESSDFVKGGKFRIHWSDFYVLKMDCASKS